MGGEYYEEPVPVWLGSEDDGPTMVSIYPDQSTGGGPPLATCRLPCGFKMHRGRYRIQVAETADTLGGSRPVSIEGPSRLVIAPRDRSTRTVGLVLGIGGAAAVITGVALLLHDVSSSGDLNCNNGVCSTSHHRDTESVAGLVLTLSGCVMTPIGWVMFGKSFRPAIDVEHVQVGAVPKARVGVVGLPGRGAGLGAALTF